MAELQDRSIRPVDAFRFCREEVKHEYNVLGSRLTSYITSQSFLFTSYGVSMANVNVKWGETFRVAFPVIVCSVGILASVRAQPGILSACKLLEALHKRQFALYEDPEVRQLDPSDNKWQIEVHMQSLKFSTAAAYIFGGAWVALLLLALYLHFGY